MQDPSRPVTGYPLPAANGCAPPTAAAYPYQLNPNPYPYSYYQAPPPPTEWSQRAPFIRRLTVVLFGVLTIMVIILFIFWLVLRPRLPEYSLQSFSQSGFNISGQRLSATWNASFRISNPNKKMSIDYNQMISSLFHKDYYLTEARLPPFEQGTHDVRTVDVSYAVVNSFLDQPVLDAINGEKAGGEMKFNVKLLANFDFHYGSFKRRTRILQVWCSNVAVSSSSGRMVGGAKDCRVG